MYFVFINILIFLLSFLTLGNFPYGNKSGNKKFVWKTKYLLVVLFFFVIGATRPVVKDTDNDRYVELYQHVQIFSELPVYLKNTEVGYSALNMLFGAVFGLPYYIFFGVITALTWGIYVASSYRYQFLLPWMLFFTISSGFLFWSFSGIRQSLAIMIFFYSIRFIIERKILYYIVTIAIASLFHSSVLLLLPLYFLSSIKFNRNFWLITYITSIFFMSSSFISTAMNKTLTSFFQLLPYFQNYAQYTVSDSFLVSREEAATDTGLGIILNISVNLFIVFFSRETLTRFPILNLYFLLFSFGAVTSNIFFSVELIGRLLSYFLIPFGLLIAATIYSYDKKHRKIVFSIFFIVYTLLFLKQLFAIVSLQ